jgi:hypothetical protein
LLFKKKFWKKTSFRYPVVKVQNRLFHKAINMLSQLDFFVNVTRGGVVEFIKTPAVPRSNEGMSAEGFPNTRDTIACPETPVKGF